MRLRRLIAALAGLLLLFGMVPAGALGAEGPTLRWLTPLPQGNDLHAVAFGADQFVAVGQYGTVLVSVGGEEWRLVPGITGDHLSQIAYGTGLFVAASAKGDLFSSADGVEWTQRAVGRGPLAGLVYGEGQFLALSADGAIALSSDDGLAWSAHEVSLPVVSVLDLAAGDGRFLALGRSRADQTLLLTSVDGVEWVVDGQVTAGYWADPRIAAGGGVPVAAGGERRLVHGSGRTWTDQLIPEGGSRARTEALLYVDGRFVQYHVQYLTHAWETRVAAARVLSSEDGLTWSAIPVAGTRAMRSIAYGAGRFVGVGNAGLIAVWEAEAEEILPLGNPTLRTVVGNGDGLVALSDSGDLLFSEDGASWAVTRSGLDGGRLSAGEGGFVYHPEYRRALISKDGLTWVEAPPDLELFQVAIGNGRFVGSAWQRISMSPDGLRWSGTDLERAVDTVAFGRGRFYALGQDQLFSSTDGMTWSQQRMGIPPADALSTTRYGQTVVTEDLFVALRQYYVCSTKWYSEAECLRSDLYTSADGLAWTLRRAGTRAVALAFDGGRYLAVGAEGHGYTSVDGIHWERVDLGTSYDLTGVTARDGEFLVSSGHGHLLGVRFVAGAGVCSSGFSDLPGAHAACPAIRNLAAAGIIGGYGDGTVGPDRQVTRAEFAKLVVLALGLSPDPAASLPFPDTAGHWAARDGYLQAAVATGAIRGYEDGTFRPDGPVTRAEAVKMALAAAGVVADPGGPGTGYGDVLQEDWHAEWVRAALGSEVIGSAGWMALWEGDRLRPNQAATRGELAILLENLRWVR